MDPVTSPLIHKDSGHQARVDPGEESPPRRAADDNGVILLTKRRSQIPVRTTSRRLASLILSLRDRPRDHRELEERQPTALARSAKDGSPLPALAGVKSSRRTIELAAFRGGGA